MFLQYVISAPEHISCDLHFILAFSMKMIINRLNLRSGPQTRICGGREETCRRWLFQWIVFPSVSVRLNYSTNSLLVSVRLHRPAEEKQLTKIENVSLHL